MEQDADATLCKGNSNLAKHVHQLENTAVL